MDISMIKDNLMKFLSDPSNFGNYSDDIKSLPQMFCTIYCQPCENELFFINRDDKYQFLEFHDGETDKPFKNGDTCKLRKFLNEFKSVCDNKGVEYVKFHLSNEFSYILTTFGIIKIANEYKDGTIDTISFTPTSAENEEHINLIMDIISSSLVIEPSVAMEKNHYKIAYIEDGMITTMTNEFDDWTTDIAKNYNDDVPYQEITNEMREEKTSLVLLYGKPGTGKSSLIKSIVNDNLDKEFIYVDSSLFTSLSNGQFLSFLNDHKGSVFILEDCEKAITDRRQHNNETINTILNITDGIVAESLKCKFICTFNCGIDNIDPALLRKGRLDVLYEFSELDKTRAIYPDAKTEMTIADAYNANKENRFGKKKQRKVGF